MRVMRRASLALSLAAALLALLPGRLAAVAQTDLDAFMERVLATRDENWKKLQQYVLEERETLRVTGPGGGPLYGFRREYSWFVKEGLFVRSPLSADGVAIGEAERRRYEAEWLRRARRREVRAAGSGADPATTAADAPGADATGATVPASVDPMDDALRQTVEPRFVSAAYFLRFKFDPGQYALVGRERVDGHDTLKVEYYPTKLFTEGRTRPDQRVRDQDDEIEEKLNKVTRVTLWIEPRAHQILRYDLDDIQMDFLPGRSLVRVEGASASMRMGEPFPGIWLPDTIQMRFRLALALGPLAARYDVQYHDYRQADVKMRVK
ncbi:MAG: hypothetical protein AB7O67_05070 [Vicinamibacterales bacterium]